MAQVTESDYRAAQQGDADVRQEFLDAIDLEDAREFVGRVEYSAVEKEGHRFGYVTAPSASMDCGINSISDQNEIRALITVYPSSFEGFSYGRFLSSFVDHEGQHARQLNQNIVGWDWIWRNKKRNLRAPFKYNYFNSIIELPARANQFAKSKKRNLTYNETCDLHGQMSHHIDRLISLRKHFLFPRNIEKDLQKILCDSEGDNFIRENLGLYLLTEDITLG